MIKNIHHEYEHNLYFICNLKYSLLIYLDEIGVDVVCVIFSEGEREPYSGVVN